LASEVKAICDGVEHARAAVVGDRGPRRVARDADRRQRLAGHRALEAEQPQQQMLAADLAMAEAPRLRLRGGDGRAGALGEPLEHPTSVPRRRRDPSSAAWMHEF
jgi:hypothetical protein